MKLFNQLARTFVVLSMIGLIVIVYAGQVSAAPGIYKKINFQGKLQDDQGLNVADGNYSIVFTLYDASSAGSNLWDETQTVAVNDGVFQVELGAVDSTIAAVDFNSDSIFLGVKVEADAEMTPRIRFTAVPYAFNAEKVGGLTVTNTTGTFTLTNGKTLEVANTLSFAGTDSTAFTFPTGSGTVVTLDSIATLTNKTLTAPKLVDGGFIADANGNEMLIFDSNASAVNELTLGNASTGNAVTLLATGETNVGLTINSKAAGALTLDSGTTGAINFGTGNNAKTINFGTGTAGNTINFGTNNTTSDTITIGSILDNIAITSDSWSVTNAGALTVTSCTGCGGGGTSYLTESSGLLRPINTTMDFSIGGTSTASSKFAVLNVNNGSPTASLSAGDTGGAFLTAAGTLATTAMQVLNIGNATTGAVNLTSGSTLGMNLLTGNSSTVANSGALSLATGSSTSGASGLISILTGNGAGSAGQISQVGTSKQGSSIAGVASQSVTFDSIPLNDDIIYLTVASVDTPAPSAPGGFTQLYSRTGVGGYTIAGYYKRASSEASATYTISFAGTNYRESVTGTVFRGTISSGNPFEVSSVGSDAYGTTPVAPSITTLTNNAWHITHFFVGSQNLTATSGPAGYTKLIGSTNAGQLVAYKQINPAGATGTTTITASGADYNLGISLSLKPGVTGGSSGAVAIGTGSSTGSLGSGTLGLSTGTTDTGGSGAISITSGNATGAGTSGNVLLDVGSVSGGTLGAVNIGTTNAQTINLGKAGAANTITGASLALAINSVNYTWPTSAPGSNGYVLSSTTGGTLSWVANGGGGGGSQTPWTSDIDGDNYSLLDMGTNITARNGLTLGTGSNGALTLTPNGTGDTIISGDADSNLQVTFGAAPGVDMVAVTNTGQGTSTTGVDGVSVNFTNAGAGSITNSGIHIETTSNNSNAASFLYGLNIDNLSSGGESSSEVALRVGTGWDQGLVIESGGSTNSGLVYSGAGRPTKTVTLSPEYAGAVITAFYGAGTDTNIVGNMTADTDTTQGTSIRNFYQWERTADATQHFYTVAVRVTLPADFDAWATSNAVTVGYKTESGTNTVSDVDVRLYNENSATIVASSLDNASTSWTTVSFDDSVLDDGAGSEWDAAGETAVIYLRMGSASSNYAQVGDIVLSYLSKF